MIFFVFYREGRRARSSPKEVRGKGFERLVEIYGSQWSKAVTNITKGHKSFFYFKLKS